MSNEEINSDSILRGENEEPHSLHNNLERVYSSGDSSTQLEMMNSFLSRDENSTTDTAIEAQNDGSFYPAHKQHYSLAHLSMAGKDHKKTQSMSNMHEMMTGRSSPKHANINGNVRPGLKTYKSAMSVKSVNGDASNSNKILPKTSFNSPFYIAVPTPPGTNASVDIYNKQSKTANTTITTTTSTSNPMQGHHASYSTPNFLSGREKPSSGDFADESTTLTTTSSSNEYPTTIIVDRFIKWKKILKALISYYREVAMAQEQFARINNNIKVNMKFGTLLPNISDNGTVVSGETTTTTATTTIQNPTPKAVNEASVSGVIDNDFSFPPRPKLGNRTLSSSSVNSNQSDDEYVNNSPSSIKTTTINTGDYLSFGNGSIQDLQVILKKHHIALAKKQYESSKELETKIIPKLEDLKKDLTFKIKEIKSLHEDFKTNIKEHVAITGQLLQKFMLSLEFIENSSISNANLFDLIEANKKNLKPKNDPYLLKLQLDLQLKRQLLEEHYLQDSYTNLQKNGLELEKIIFLNIQKSLSKYSNLIDSQVRITMQTLCNDLNHGILNKPPAVEWDNFVLNHPTSLLNWKSNDPFPVYRKLTDIKYPHMKSALAKCVRAGYLLKKNKLKKYNRSYFILTSNYLHEFKSSDFFKSTTNNNDDAFVNRNAKNLLTPIMSINLNYAFLEEYNDEKMVIKLTDVATAGAFQDEDLDQVYRYPNSTVDEVSPSAHVPNTSTVSKKLGKLWKKPQSTDILSKLNSSNSLSSAPPSKSNSPILKTVTNSVETSFYFRFDSSGDISEQESKALFKKWVQDIKQLCSYDTSTERAKYIHDKVVNLKLEHAQRNNVLKSKTNASSATLKTSKQAAGTEKPSHIEMPSVPKKFALPNPGSNVVMTPSIDEHGNLITVNEPRMLNPDDNTSQNSNFSRPTHIEVPAKGLSSSNNSMFSPGTDSLGKGSNESIKLISSPQENIPTTSKNSSDSSPAIQSVAPYNYNAAGGGGYFGIPVKKTTSNTSMTNISKTVQSPASVARKVMGKPASPQPQKPIFARSSSSNSVTTVKKTNANPGNAIFAHKRISSLNSLTSLTNKIGPKSSKLSQMAEESDFEGYGETNNSTIDVNKSLYD